MLENKLESLIASFLHGTSLLEQHLDSFSPNEALFGGDPVLLSKFRLAKSRPFVWPWCELIASGTSNRYDLGQITNLG
jgi:hypothetical protein